MRALLVASLLLVTSTHLSAQLGKELGGVSQVRGANATDAQIASALKEALSVGSVNAIKIASAENGFWDNASIKIRMPDPMRNLEQGLRMAGQGIRLNDFELSMNRAAEMAATSAEPLFAKAIAGLKFTDARGILNGNHTAATEYLMRNASVDMIKSFRPTVEAAMNRTGVMPNYDALFAQMKGLTMGQAQPFDIADYMVRQTLNGLFIMVSSEEDKIRNDPQAQGTPLVKEVFAKH
jgi:hypothetical protein